MKRVRGMINEQFDDILVRDSLIKTKRQLNNEEHQDTGGSSVKVGE